MTRPTDNLSDAQLKKGLGSGEFEGRDALIAEEILKRRHQENERMGDKTRYPRSSCGGSNALGETSAKTPSQIDCNRAVRLRRVSAPGLGELR